MRAAGPFSAVGFALLIAMGSIPGVGPLIVAKAIHATMARHAQGSALEAPNQFANSAAIADGHRHANRLPK